jgi:sn1-specific diacylglycerol lipase
VASSTVVATALAFDDTILGRRKVTAPVVEGAVSSAIDFAETLTLAPIYLGECISSASLRAAHSSIDILSIIFPGSSEASFSLGPFIDLVKREWDNPTPSHVIPVKKYGITDVARALIAWVALQGVTQEHHESRWSPYLREVEVHSPTTGPQLKRVPSRIRVTSDLIFPGHRGQLISADIGEAPPTTHSRQRSASVLSRLSISSVTSSRWRDARPEHCPKSTEEVKMNLRRFSKMVLAGYGGASLLFFGVSPLFASPSVRAKAPTVSNEKEAEEAQLEQAINAAEAEMEGTSGTLPPSLEDNIEYSWWDIFLGKHDKEIFERSVHGGRPNTQNVQSRMRATAVIGIERQMPRFWVLTDHDRCQVVLVLRGAYIFYKSQMTRTLDERSWE